MNIHDKSRYHEVHARSLSDPEGFWAEAAREIDWIEPPRKIFDASMGTYGRWFVGGVVNTCYNALDRHVANGRGDQVALIHDSPLANTISKFTYAEMLREVQALAAVMQDFRSEEHTSELQSHSDLVCRLLLEKKKNRTRSDEWGRTESVWLARLET